ncbi:hypothetical protein GMRT_13179 [Giardia muris]|uniref:EF-hand domain-containing protein n=1 Tax=Giardia muris TaxID=5742 RepID=A0A4Z1SRV2_GIAMU|nr:hypothetical protein GMRT_13179 [Giardia muris]|eukprot:TNJ28654.1 hypothetical protein GMRT_13179 [Giardia muris]
MVDRQVSLCASIFSLLDRDQNGRLDEDEVRDLFSRMYGPTALDGLNIRGLIDHLSSTREPALDFVEVLDFIKENNLLSVTQSREVLTNLLSRLRGSRLVFTLPDLEALMHDFGYEVTIDELRDVTETFTGQRSDEVSPDVILDLFSNVVLADIQ